MLTYKQNYKIYILYTDNLKKGTQTVMWILSVKSIQHIVNV